MNLMTGKLYWPTTVAEPPRYPELSEDLLCDVVIVGGGIAGGLCAHYLMKHDVDVVLIEKGWIGEGSSRANLGMLQFANDKSLTSCLRSFGEERGRRFYQLCRQALDQLEIISRSLTIFPDFQRKDSLYFASQPQDVESLRIEYENLIQHGFPVSYWGQEEIESHFSFSKPAAIYSKGDAQINPYKLSVGLIADAAAQGMRVYEQTEVVHQKEEAGDMLILTGKGSRIRCKRIVFATGYEAQALKRNPNAIRSSTSAIVTKPVKSFLGWPKASLIWETARPYMYIRANEEGRIVVGGLDEPNTDPKHREMTVLSKRDLLLEKVQALFPQLSLEVEYYWSAAFASTHDGLPMFGEQKDYPNCLFSLGYGGNGTVYSTIGGQIIADLIVKGENPDAALFSFERPKFASSTPKSSLS